MDIKPADLRERNERRFPPVRRKTIDQLAEQLFAVQRLCQWLAWETHGDAYVRVRELNELFHLANRQLRDIKNGSDGDEVRPARARRSEPGGR